MKLFFHVAALSMLSLPAVAQNLAGTWQGAEDPKVARYYPAVLRLRAGAGGQYFGVLYQELGPQPEVTVTFQVSGRLAGSLLRLDELEKLAETGQSPTSYWCEGSLSLTYDPAQEKLTGRATYVPMGSCDVGDFVFYRVKLKSAATVPAGAATTLRVSGRDVRWYADPEGKQLVARGNSFPTKLSKTTTFYLTQGYFPSAESRAVPITVAVEPPKKTRRPAAPPVAARPPAPRPAAPAPLASRRAAAPATVPTEPAKPAVRALAALPLPAAGAKPLALPTVLFKLSTAVLLPGSFPALKQLAEALRAQPEVRLRIVGHTDRLPGDSPANNQKLSEDRAAAVKEYLVGAGIAAERLETAGYGDTRRLHPSPDVRNRRVEIERLP